MLEIIFTLIGAAFEAFAFISFSKRVKQTEVINIVVVWLFALAGYAIGGLSVWLYPHPLVRDANLRLACVFIVPLCAALLVFLIGQFLTGTDSDNGIQKRLASVFLGSFMGTMGITLVRFLFA